MREPYTDTLEGLVDDALEREKVDDRAAAKPALAVALRVSLDELAAKLDEHPLATEEDARALEGGVLWLDELFAAHVERTGKQGKLEAADTRAKSTERVERGAWPEAFERWDRARPLSLAAALWCDKVGPRLEEARRKPPAWAMCVAEPVAHLFSKVRREEERNGQRTLRLPDEVLVRIAHSAATIGADTLDALMIDRGVKLFGSLASHRVLRWQIFTGHRQALEGNSDPRVIRVDGGWSTLAHDVLGMKGKRAADEVRDIVEAMHATELPLPPRGNYQRLLLREAHTPRGRGQQWIKLVLGTALLPDYVHELQEAVGHTLEGRRAVRLVPVLDVPPGIGRDNERGAQATLSMLLVAYMRDNAREHLEHGGVELDNATLTELARRAGLTRDMTGPLLDRWTHDGDDGPAFLKLEGTRYTLGDTHAAARTFIEDGGRRELEGREAGKKGARRRRAKLAKGGRPDGRKAMARVDQIPHLTR